MVRTQIYLEKDQILQIKLEAQKNNLKMSEIIRLALDKYFQSKTNEIDWEKDPLDACIGALELDADMAQNHDKYLYGKDNE